MESTNIKGLREVLSDQVHEQWSGWMKHIFTNSNRMSDGSYVIPYSLANRWERQLNTKYADLPENEKDSDRREADKFIQLIYSDKPNEQK